MVYFSNLPKVDTHRERVSDYKNQFTEFKIGNIVSNENNR